MVSRRISPLVHRLCAERRNGAYPKYVSTAAKPQAEAMEVKDK